MSSHKATSMSCCFFLLQLQSSSTFSRLPFPFSDSCGTTLFSISEGWARVPFLNEDEEAVLMTRSQKGLTRPLAESVLGLASNDQLGEAHPGVPWRLEYVVLAQIPKKT